MREALIRDERLSPDDLLALLARHGLHAQPHTIKTTRNHILGTLQMMRALGIEWQSPRPQLRRPGTLPRYDDARLGKLEARVQAVENRLAGAGLSEAAE